MLNSIKNLIKRAIITGNYDESVVGTPIQQVDVMGKIVDAEMIFPYGSFANLPADTTVLGLVFAVGNDDDDLSVIGYTPLSRPKGVEPGELVHYHPVTGSKVHFRNNGDIDVTTDGENGSANITVKKDLNIVVSGDANITVSGDTTLDTNQLNVNSSLTNLGSGGSKIARLGDSVEVTVSSGSSAGLWSGTITGAGTNTSI